MLSGQKNNTSAFHSEDIYTNSLFNKNKEIERYDYNVPFLNKFVPKDKNISILDAGCGNGKYARYLHNLGYKKLIAVDLFETIEYNEIDYKKATIDNLPFQDNFFDFIYSFSVIYHLQFPEKGISEFKRVLKPNGILIFSGHTRYSLHTIWRKLMLLIGNKTYRNLKNAKFYSTKRYLNILKSNNFEIVHIDGFHLSLIFYPFYRRKMKWFENKFHVELPVVKGRVSRFKFLGKIKSLLAYHFVIVCKKL